MIADLRIYAIRAADWLVSLARPFRQSLALALDLCLCLFATWLAFYLRLGDWSLWTGQVLFVAGLAGFVWMLLALRLQIYQSIIRFTGRRTVMALALGCVLLAVILSAVLLPLQVPGVPRTVALIQPLVLFTLLSFSRMIISHLLFDVLHMAKADAPPRRVLIYGAGVAGTQLAASLQRERGIVIAGFIDDDRRLDLRKIDGLTVWASSRLADVLSRQSIDEMLLAIPSATRARRRDIIEELRAHDVHVRSLPSVANMIDGRVSISDLREVEVEELLGRDPVMPNQILMGRKLTGKRVMVTGAGGSIGSELCRQIVRCRPRQLVLVDHAEFSLYAIESELRKLVAAEDLLVELVTELGSVADRDTAHRLMHRWLPQTVFHAAAYKHVPMVEANPIAGIGNNVLGTLFVCMAAEAAKVESFMLVSTDKAVRPTNVMGASKRLCELVLQARAAERTSSTVFSMVRFGNVLGSSGSVVPTFRAQIAAGGPITVTHRDITRYFMTIPEAAQLVIQASAMARGGEVFLLDMGEPVRIADLARAMVRLSGLTVRDTENPDGEIEIVESGLRPGEKLYEELLIDETAQPTHHDRIMTADEAYVLWSELEGELKRLQDAIRDGDVPIAMAIIQQLVPEYQPFSPTLAASA